MLDPEEYIKQLNNKIDNSFPDRFDNRQERLYLKELNINLHRISLILNEMLIIIQQK